MKTLLKVETEDDKNYNISCDEGVTVTEVIYAAAIAGRALLKANFFDSPIAIEAMFHKYLTSDEFNEVEEEEDVSDTGTTEQV